MWITSRTAYIYMSNSTVGKIDKFDLIFSNLVSKDVKSKIYLKNYSN